MWEVTSGYSASENDFFLRDCHLLAEFEFEAFDNRLNTDGLASDNCSRDELLAMALRSDFMSILLSL